MSFELTEQQLHSLDSELPAPRVVDPRTNTAYVLIRADLYERLKGVFDEDFQPRDAYAAIDRAFAEVWDDPKMDDYDRYDRVS